MFPVFGRVSEKVLPGEALYFLECFGAFLELGCIEFKQFILKCRVIDVQEYPVVIATQERLPYL